MKSLLLLMAMAVSSFASADDSNILILKKSKPTNAPATYVHVGDKHTDTKVTFLGAYLQRLQKNLMTNDSKKIYCDGKYEYKTNRDGLQFLALRSVDVCIDEDGWLIASNFGGDLSKKQIRKIHNKLLTFLQSKTAANINNGNLQKEVGDSVTPLKMHIKSSRQ